MEDIALHAGSDLSNGKTFSLNEETLATVFQPIISLGGRAREIFGYEALTRGPAGSPIEDPTNLFLRAHEQGKLCEVDIMCLRNTLKNSRPFPAGTKIFINIHPLSLGKSTRSFSDILHLIENLGMDSHQFILELVEQFPVHNIDMFLGNIAMLRREGVLIGLDDIGAGYADFFILSKIKPDFLKVGGYFSDHIKMNSIKQKVVRAVVELSQEFNAMVIAEGIERKEDLHTLESLGVHLGQGFYFARPAPFDKLQL